MDHQPQPTQNEYPAPAYAHYTHPPQPPPPLPPPAPRHPRCAFIIVPVALAFILVAGVVFWMLASRPQANSTAGLKVEPKVGSLAPDFELKDTITGETVKLSSLRGRPVWINFWATWCPPCRDEMPDMEKIYGEYKDKGLVILGVDDRENDQKVKEFTSSLELTWTFAVDGDGSVGSRYYVTGIPAHFFVDKDGVIRAIHTGGLTNISGTRKVDPRQYLEKIITP